MEVHIRQQGAVGPLDRNMQQKQKLKETNKQQTLLQVCFGPWFLTVFCFQIVEQQCISLQVVFLKGRVGWLLKRTGDTTLRPYSEDLYTTATTGSIPYKNRLLQQ